MQQIKPERFARLLADAIELIAFRKQKSRQAIQDEIGYALGRSGGTALAYWIYRKRIPARLTDIELLARLIAQYGGWEDPSYLLAFLESSGHPNALHIARRILPNAIPLQLQADEWTDNNSASPFLVGPPVLLPRQFFGRTRELKRIFNVLKGPTLQNIAIVGKQRSGKTSLLHFIKNSNTTLPAQLHPAQAQEGLERARRRWVFINFQDPRMCTQDGFFKHTLSQLLLPNPNPCNLHTFIDVVSEQLSGQAIILIDELQAALSIPDLDNTFWQGLRSLGAYLTEGRLGFISASQMMPEQWMLESSHLAPFLNIFGHRIELGPLTKEEALQLIQSAPRPFDPCDVEWILETSRCWPALLQILCMARWTSLEESQPGKDWRKEGLRNIAPYQHLLK